MPEYDDCGNCGREVTDDSDFCPFCGVLFEHAPMMVCEVHRAGEAFAVCVICQKFLCEFCAVEVENRFLCPDHQDVRLSGDYALIYESRDVAEAAAVRSLLTPGGVASEDDEGNVHSEGEDNSPDVIDTNLFTRGRTARIYVPIPRYLEASEVLREWREDLKSS